MKLGIHFMNFTHPGGGAALRAAVGDTAVVADQAGLNLGYLTMLGDKIAGPLSEIG